MVIGMKKKVIFVPGIFNPKWYQFRWKKECEKMGYEFLCFKKPFYSYWNIKRMRELISEGKKMVEKNPNSIIVCHSFGGILFNCILQKISKPKIKKTVFITCPFGMNILGMRKRKKVLGYDEDLKYNFESVSFGAYFDELVPFVWTRYRNERHYNLFVDHMAVLFVKRVVRKIMRLSKID